MTRQVRISDALHYRLSLLSAKLRCTNQQIAEEALEPHLAKLEKKHGGAS